MQSKKQVRTQIKKEYKKFTSKDAKSPGINELLKLYGQFEESLKQNQNYMELIRLPESVTTSNSSSPS